MTTDPIVTDLPYAERDGETLLARVYRPPGAERAPAVVSVHPGAWSMGDRTWGRPYDEPLARAGFVVVALDFRQGPAHRHPAGSADVATGVRWTRACAKRLGADASRIGAIGSSSGGHLALLAACRPDAPEHHGAPRGCDGDADVLPHADASVACIAAFWPPVDTLARYEWISERRAAAGGSDPDFDTVITGMDAYFGDRDSMRAASVPRIVRDGEATHLPPAWICHAGADRVVPFEGVLDLERTWRAAGGEISVSVYDGETHAFGHRAGEASARFVAELIAFCRRHLGE